MNRSHMFSHRSE